MGDEEVEMVPMDILLIALDTVLFLGVAPFICGLKQENDHSNSELHSMW